LVGGSFSEAHKEAVEAAEDSSGSAASMVLLLSEDLAVLIGVGLTEMLLVP
jgi:hypothetical protein